MYRPDHRLVEMMAWLSLCLLTAAWAPRFDSDWRNLWTAFGLIGLSAAVGFDTATRVRLSRKRRQEEERTLAHYEHTMSEVLRRQQAETEVAEVVREIVENPNRQASCAEVDGAAPRPSMASYADRRSEPRTMCWIPVDVMIEGPRGRWMLWDEDGSAQAHLRDISRSGFRLMHRQPLDVQRVVLEFERVSEQPVAMSARLLWSKPETNGWFASGGRFVRILPAGARDRCRSVQGGGPEDGSMTPAASQSVAERSGRYTDSTKR